MRLRLSLSGATLALLVLTAPALADAPIGDPQYEAFDSSSTTISDRKTILTWDRNRVLRDKGFALAASHCDAVFPGVGRVPTVKELLTLVDEEGRQVYDTTFNPPFVYKYIDQTAFADAPTNKPYWTSTVESDGKVWTVDFSTGKTQLSAPADLNHLRCVR